MTDGKPAALVTGAGTGIGKAAALALARAGYDVAINYSRSADGAKDTAAQAEKAGVRAITVQADVSDDASVRKMLETVKSEFGRLDGLINNAGTTMEVEPKDFEGVDVDEWDRVFAVNVRSVFLVTRAATPMLREAKGAIVNTCSIAGLRPGPQPLAYAASKASVVNLTKTLAGALGPEIRVNGVAPGWMEGDWMIRMLGDNYDRLMERRARATPLKRCVTADDVGETMCNFITSNRFVTGEIVIIDGGFASTT